MPSDRPASVRPIGISPFCLRLTIRPTAFGPANVCPSGRFGDPEKGIQMRSDENLMTVDLVVAASQMLFRSGGESFRKTGMPAAGCAPGLPTRAGIGESKRPPAQVRARGNATGVCGWGRDQCAGGDGAQSARRWRRVRAWAMKVLEAAARRRGRLSRCKSVIGFASGPRKR
jgi:hypothetical protein